MSCTGVILAGGEAVRYGRRAKGLERVGGERIIDRVATALRGASDGLLQIANVPDSVNWLPGVRIEGDVRRGEGALGGLHAALSHAGTDILAVAWDMPFVPTDLLVAMRARGERDGVDAVLPASERSGRGVEPLCAWYSQRCLGAVTASLDAGDRRVVAFHGAVRVARLSHVEVAAFGDPEQLFANVNAPEDLEALDARERSRGRT